MLERIKWYRRLRREGSSRNKARISSKMLVERGLSSDFELPYPYPQNEHEEGMNWVSVNAVTSGRADW